MSQCSSLLRIPLLAAVILAAGAAPAQGREPLVDKVKDSIKNGIQYLRDIENGKGDFEHTTAISRVRPGGVTALAVVALLQAGVPPDDDLIKRCLKYLRELPPSQTYTVGLQTMAFSLAGYEEDRQRIQKNLTWLNDTYIRENERGGIAAGWGYDNSIRSPDHSINQYALLGIHEAHLAGLKIDRDILADLRKFYDPAGASGAWHYRNSGRPTLTMTTAGLCNLLIASQDLERKKNLDDRGVDETCGVYPEDTTVNRAIKWIGQSPANGGFPDDIQRAVFPHPYYTLYGIERAGRLTGRRFFGGKDWYRVGCEYLVAVQNKNGSWQGNGGFDHWPPVATPLALLFLSKGRTPVLISKLAHGEVRERREAWNNKRHDVRHVVEFCSRELFDRVPLGWQVFDCRTINRPEKELAEDLLQTPIVYINGHSLTRFVDSREEKVLKEFVENGGFILGEACCGSEEFTREFRALIKRITDSELTPLTADHPVWTASGKYKVRPGSYKLEGLNKGCKTVVMFLPEPIAGWWENNDTASEKGKQAFHMAANIVAYATGMELPKPRLTEVEIVKDSEGKKPPRGYLQVAQLVRAREAQLLAPKAIPNLMAEVSRLQLEVDRQPKKLTLTTEDVLDFKFFYMHDRNGFQAPPAAQLENLRFTLENGGLLLADAACGSKRFDASFRELIAALWPKEKYPNVKLVPIDPKENLKPNELFSEEVNGKKIEKVKYRREEPVPGEKDRTQPSKEFQEGPPQLEGVKINGRWVVIYSKYDIGCALEKHQSTDCLGHDHDSAKLLARAVILYALRR